MASKEEACSEILIAGTCYKLRSTLALLSSVPKGTGCSVYQRLRYVPLTPAVRRAIRNALEKKKAKR